MSVKQRGESWEAAFMYGGRRFRKSFKDEGMAREWQGTTLGMLKAGIDPTAVSGGGKVPQTLQALLEVTASDLWSKNRAGDGSEANAKDCLAILGASKRPSQVTADDLIAMVKKFKDPKGRNLSGATVNRKVAAIRKMLRYAHKRQWIATLPYMPAMEREDGARDRYLTPEEEAKVIAHFVGVGHPEMADLTMFLLDTGVRLSTALATREEWHRDGRIDYPATVMKSDVKHSVFLTARAKTILARRGWTEGLLFANLTVDAAEYYWRKMRAILHYDEDEGFVMHALRHTFCSRLAMAGVPIVTIKELAAHANISTTMRYAHLSDKTLAAAMATLEATYAIPQTIPSTVPQAPQAPQAFPRAA